MPAMDAEPGRRVLFLGMMVMRSEAIWMPGAPILAMVAALTIPQASRWPVFFLVASTFGLMASVVHMPGSKGVCVSGVEMLAGTHSVKWHKEFLPPNVLMCVLYTLLGIDSLNLVDLSFFSAVGDYARVIFPVLLALMWLMICHGAGHLYNPVSTMTGNVRSTAMFADATERAENMVAIKQVSAGEVPTNKAAIKRVLYLATMVMRSEATYLCAVNVIGAVVAILVPIEARAFIFFTIATLFMLMVLIIHLPHKRKQFPEGLEMLDGPHVAQWAAGFLPLALLMSLLWGALGVDSLNLVDLSFFGAVGDYARVVLPILLALMWLMITHGTGHGYNPVSTMTGHVRATSMFEDPDQRKENLQFLTKATGEKLRDGGTNNLL